MAQNINEDKEISLLEKRVEKENDAFIKYYGFIIFEFIFLKLVNLLNFF